MPDFISHSIFADDILHKLQFRDRQLCGDYANIFRLGSQGADLLYYAAYLKRGDRFTERANELHGININTVIDVIKRKLSLCRTNKTELAYLYGYLAHMCLDEAVHPYVYKRADELSAALGVAADCAHVMLESLVEAKQLYLRRNISPRRFNFKNDLPKNPLQCSIVSQEVSEIAKSAGLPTVNASHLFLAVSRLPLLFSVIFDKSGVVKLLLDTRYNLTRNDFEVRWHIKRPYREAFYNSVLSADDYDSFERLSADALARYGEIVNSL